MAEVFPGFHFGEAGPPATRTSVAERVETLLAFFGVASVAAWQARYGSMQVAFRQSPGVASENTALATWLRLGEIVAEKTECDAYDARRFRTALRAIRGLSRELVAEIWSSVQALCQQNGVALIYVEPLPRAAVSGAARWLTPRKALIQLSGRYKTNDQFWFSFFHEAAHLLLHSKRTVFVNSTASGTLEVTSESEAIESEANVWAANWLVSSNHWKRFAATWPRRSAEVTAFAEKQGIAPGIVVGRLQREGKLPWTHLNGLKEPGQPPIN